MRAARRTPLAFVTLALAATAVAGCIGDGPADDPVVVLDSFLDPMLAPDGHDHADYAQHKLSWNMTELGWTPLVEGAAVAWGEIDVKGDMAVVAFAWPTAGLATVDVSDPAKPRLLDSLDLGYGYGADVKWSKTGDFAVLAVQAHANPGLPVDPLAPTTQSGLELLHVTPEGEIHDIGWWTPAPGGGVHMVATHVINGQEYVFAAYNTAGVSVYRLEPGTPIGARLVPVDVVNNAHPSLLMESPTNAVPDGVHDMTVFDDPILQKPLLYVSDGYRGLFVYDVGQPESKTWRNAPLGSWKDAGNSWYMHTAQATVTEDGRRIIVLTPEVFLDAETSVVAPLWFLDATDLSDIRLLSTWKNPGEHGADELRFSSHNFQLVGDKVVIAHYHGGVWTIDLDLAAEDLAPKAVGYHLPSNDPGRPMSGIYHGVYHMEDAPTVWDVVVHHGVVWASDVNSGVYAIATPAWTPGDVNVTSIG